MGLDRTSTVAAFVAASLAYIGVTLASTGQFDVREWAAFAVSFLLLFYVGERAFARWAGELRSGSKSPASSLSVFVFSTCRSSMAHTARSSVAGVRRT